MRGGVALEEQNETKTAKQPVISGKVLWVALGACAVWLAAVGVMLIMKLTQPPLPPNMLDYTCELDVDIPAEPVVPEKKKPSILPEYREMYEKNHDMAGWLKIEGTNVDYPVMHVKGFDPKKPIDYGEVYDKNMYYLTHDFDKEYSFSGCVTADY